MKANKCVYCKEDSVTFIGLIGWVCRECLKTKVWPSIQLTDQDIDDYLETAYEQEWDK